MIIYYKWLHQGAHAYFFYEMCQSVKKNHLLAKKSIMRLRPKTNIFLIALIRDSWTKRPTGPKLQIPLPRRSRIANPSGDAIQIPVVRRVVRYPQRETFCHGSPDPYHGKGFEEVGPSVVDARISGCREETQEV
jgi:hypothetical protein